MLEQAQYQNAADQLRPFAAMTCDPRFSLLLAASYEGMSNLRDAEGSLQQAQVAWPENNSISASLAREYMRTGETEKAVHALERFHATAATPQQELSIAGVTFIAGHRLKAAETVTRIDYGRFPSVQTLLLLANTLQLEGRYKDVIALLESQRKQYAQSAPFLITLAESNYDASIYDTAGSDLEHAIELEPQLHQAHYLLGNVLMKQGDVDRAATEYREAIRLAPDQPRAYYQLALALRAKQEEAGEESLLAKAVALDDHFALAYSEMGRILLSQNRLPEAVVQLNLAIQCNASLEQPYSLLARVYDKLGDLDKAKTMANRLTAVRAANHNSFRRKGHGSGRE